jgi:hypothetical protein
MSRPGYPQDEYLDEKGRDQVFNSDGTSYYRDWSHRYQSSAADSVGNNSPGWPAHKVENDYVGYRVRRHCSAASCTGVFNSGSSTLAGTFPISDLHAFNPIYGFDVPGLSPSDLLPGVISKLQSKIKNQKVNIGQVIAEYSKTCELVASTATRIASAITQMKRGNMKGALGALGGLRGRGGRANSHGGRSRPKYPPSSGSVSKDWLTVQYGVKPLLQDVDGACEELATDVVGRPSVGSASATRSGEYSDVFVLGQRFPWTPPIRFTRRVSASIRGYVEYRVSSQMAAIAASTGITNPLALAWELIPYSFVADWFLPVGTFLSNLDFAVGIEISRSYSTFKSQGTTVGKTVSGTYSGSGITETWSGGSDRTEVKYFSRSIGLPILTPQLPSFKDPRSLLHSLNAIALLKEAVDD